MRGAPVSAALAALLLAGCSGTQRVLDPHSPAAARIADLWWVMLALATAVCVIVTVLLLLAVRHSRQRSNGKERREVNGRALVWAGGAIIPAIILLGVLVYSFRVGAAVYPPPVDGETPLTIEVIGHQFWWEVRYPEYGVVTANEVHLPVGRQVRFQVSSPDVIHSFWIPQLQGKIDMIPGRIHTLWVRVDEPGSYRGQCAEFCGEGHALMALWTVAQPPAEFEAWIARRTPGAPEPDDPLVRRGREVFFAAGCGQCHATRGVPLPPALGAVGPDLTDLATRRTLAAGTLPNTRDALAAWIAAPERIKPGSLMPPTRLPDGEMQALLTYLQSLR